MIRNRYVGLAIVAIAAVIGSTITMVGLSAQDPPTATPQPLTSAVATVDAELDSRVTYCDYRSDGITVNGGGAVKVPANIGVVYLGVDVTADTVSEARSQAAESMTAVIDAVKAAGVDADDITTTQLNIWPESTWVEETFELDDGTTGRRNRQVVTGYRVTNRVRVQIDLSESGDEDEENGDLLGDVIDAAAAAGGDDVRVDSISFEAGDTSEAVNEARKLAAQDAIERAELYAEAFGVGVGTLLSATESFSSAPVFKQAEARLAAASFDAPTPISAGDVSITASITAKFAIDQPGCVDKASALKSKDAVTE